VREKGTKKKKKKKNLLEKRERGEEYAYRKPQISVKNCPLSIVQQSQKEKNREIRKPKRKECALEKEKKNRRRKKLE
jgi:hypothetical protein